MKISSQSRYAIRLLLDIAQQGEGAVVSLKEISGRQNVSVKYLEQIVLRLNKHGYLQSVRGAMGGYRLSRAPKDYRIGDVLRAVEGSLAPINCLKSEINECEHCDQCDTLWFWEGMDKAINQYVDQFTLQDFVDHDLGLI
jgi:Rrf2 family protein